MLSSALICLVAAISDGDTLSVRCGGAGHFEQRQVRIHAIDAPERYQAFSDASRSSLVKLCLHVSARIRQVGTDDYGRTVGQVECRGEDVAAYQVRNGLAWVYPRYAQTRGDLLALQSQARSTGAGLWADSQPVAPWIWRNR